MYLFKNKITLENKPELEKFLQSYPHRTSGMTFTSLYMWRNQYEYSYEVISGFLCIAGRSDYEAVGDEQFIFPLLPASEKCDIDDLRSALAEIRARLGRRGNPFVMGLIPSHMVEHYKKALPGETVFLRDTFDDDYVYRVDELAELRGRRFHAKKNHVNAFNKEYEGRYEVKTFEASMAPEALALLGHIDSMKQVDNYERALLDMEAAVLSDILPDYDKLGFEGCAIFIDGRMEAFAFGARMSPDTIVEHVEKGNIEFRGIYQKLNSEFCRMMQGRYEYVNREEDMGIEGLRKAKESYKPCRMEEKYIMVMKDDQASLDRYSTLDEHEADAPCPVALAQGA